MKEESCLDCSTIGGCPFSFTQESEKIQNYGCLPTPYQIIKMKNLYNKSWACHSNPTKPCLGAINYLKENSQNYQVNELITEKDDWSKFIK